MSPWSEIWREILTPSARSESAYMALLIGIAHGALGGVLSELAVGLGLAAVAARALIPLAYWLIKERADLDRGGSVRDGLTDSLHVAVVPILSSLPDFNHEYTSIVLVALVSSLLQHRKGS